MLLLSVMPVTATVTKIPIIILLVVTSVSNVKEYRLLANTHSCVNTAL